MPSPARFLSPSKIPYFFFFSHFILICFLFLFGKHSSSFIDAGRKDAPQLCSIHTTSFGGLESFSSSIITNCFLFSKHLGEEQGGAGCGVSLRGPWVMLRCRHPFAMCYRLLVDLSPMAACCDAGSGTQVMGDGCGAALGHSVMLQCCLCTVTFLYFQLLPKIMKYKTRVTTALFIEQSFQGVDFLFLFF